MSEPKFSRWLNGRQVYVSPEDMALLSVNIAHTDKEKADLIIAHLKDECQGPGAELVEISFKTDFPYILQDTSAMYGATHPPLPPKLERAFAVLRENITDPDVRDILLSLADLLSKKRGPEPEPEPKPEPERQADPGLTPIKQPIPEHIRRRPEDKLTRREKN